jgi:hypothetical protein
VTADIEIANWEIFVWSLSQLGGKTTFVDVEVAFISCFDLAPNRFSWRTREDLPDYKKCSKALQEAEARRPRLLLKTRDGLKRQLTVEGQHWVSAHEPRMVAALHSGKTVAEPTSRPRARMLADVERSAMFEKWSGEGELPSEKWQVAELLRCSPDSDWRIWRDRLEILRAGANGANRERLLRFLDELAVSHADWFREVDAAK